MITISKTKLSKLLKLKTTEVEINEHSINILSKKVKVDFVLHNIKNYVKKIHSITFNSNGFWINITWPSSNDEFKEKIAKVINGHIDQITFLNINENSGYLELICPALSVDQLCKLQDLLTTSNQDLKVGFKEDRMVLSWD